MKTHNSLPCLLALASLLGFPLSSRAAAVVVNTLADGGPGSLREAVAFAGTNAGGAVITFEPALSGQIIVLTNGQMVLSNQVTIDASALPEGITVSAGHLKGTLQPGWELFRANWPGRLHRVFDVVGQAPAVELNNLTIHGGYAAFTNFNAFNPDPEQTFACGGGIRAFSGATVTLNHCTLIGNYAQSGGGAIATSSATIVLNNCGISNNIATLGGGIYARPGSSPNIITLNNSIVCGNAAIMFGGGIYGKCVLNSSTVWDNFALRGGGGILVRGVVPRPGGDATLNNSTVAGNVAPFGAGIGISSPATVASLNNSTVSGNTAGFSGGGIEHGNAINSGGTERVLGFSFLTNSIVAGNTAPANPTSYWPSNVTSLNSLTNGNPMLAALGNYGGPTPTMPPLSGSPALDAGTDSVTNFLATDQRGYPRLSGAHVDIGAVEAQGAPANNPPLLRLSFTSPPNADFTVLGSTNLSQWNILGPAAHNPPGQYHFTDPEAANHPKRFYRATSP